MSRRETRMCKKLFLRGGFRNNLLHFQWGQLPRWRDTFGRMNHSSYSHPWGLSLLGSNRLLSVAFALITGLASSQLSAQPGSPDGPGGPPSSFALSDVTATYSFSSDGDVERNGKVGSVGSSHYEFEASFSLPAPESWMFSSTLSWKRYEFDLTGAVPIPKDLEEVGIDFMAMKDLSKSIGPGWSARAMLNPGFASESGKISGDSFSFMGVAMIGKEVSPTFSWSAGIMGQSRGDMKVMPVVGIRWDFAPDWELAIGFPDTGISYRFSEALTLKAGAEFHGGSYYISKAPAAGLGKTYMDYEEIRLGLSAEYQVSKNLSLVIEGGTTASRTFDYYDRNVKLDGKSTGYGGLSLKYQF